MVKLRRAGRIRPTALSNLACQTLLPCMIQADVNHFIVIHYNNLAVVSVDATRWWLTSNGSNYLWKFICIFIYFIFTILPCIPHPNNTETAHQSNFKPHVGLDVCQPLVYTHSSGVRLHLLLFTGRCVFLHNCIHWSLMYVTCLLPG